MNDGQRRIRKDWKRVLSEFAKREWTSALISAGLGVITAGIFHLLFKVQSFQSFLVTKYKPAVSFDDPRVYVPLLIISLIAFMAAITPVGSSYIIRGVRSWWTGVTSGLIVLSFGSAFFFSVLPSELIAHRLSWGFIFELVWLVTSFFLHLRARVQAERGIPENEFKVSQSNRSIMGTELSDSDDPINTWAQDALGRAALVDSLSVKIMIGKAPVITLTGPFGSGKTSTLNLLREHLSTVAIVVSFSTWLPGSAETLASYLMADIAEECNKKYIVPGLRQSTRRLASALARKIPFLGEYLKIGPATTQRDDVRNLGAALARLPKRIVVLLDEIDRMEKEELLTLLKVIRGISSLPNLTFVCAGDHKVIIRTIGKNAKENDVYFEKFFPVLINVPEPETAALKHAGIDRLVQAFVRKDWFESKSDRQKFKERLEALWDVQIAPFCRNLRAIGLLANDIGIASAPLWREVDPVDLTLIEVLHRFKPTIYELVARNSLTLTGGESMFRGGPYLTDKDVAKNKERFATDLNKIGQDDAQLDQIKAILSELFPIFAKGESFSVRVRLEGGRLTDIGNTKRIREPRMFPAYFRFELPNEIFSSVEMENFLKKFESAQNPTKRENMFAETLSSIQKGSLKRDDFLHKLGDSLKSIDISGVRDLGLAVAKTSAQYTYDLFPSFEEAGEVLRIILRISQRLSQTDRVTFLKDCIRESSDDTMALRIVMVLPEQKNESNIHVKVGELYPTFVQRMRERYGENVEATAVDLSTSDPWAFDYWGRIFKSDEVTSDPEDRRIQRDFWIRYIGNSRHRLLEAFRNFFFPVAAYSEDPALAVENKIPVADLKKLYEELPEDGDLNDQDKKTSETLRRFLAGEFKGGISPTDHVW
jgi:predicted KAP-like P-loop ATPase